MTRGDKNVIQSILGGWKSFFSIGKSGDGGITAEDLLKDHVYHTRELEQIDMQSSDSSLVDRWAKEKSLQARRKIQGNPVVVDKAMPLPDVTWSDGLFHVVAAGKDIVDDDDTRVSHLLKLRKAYGVTLPERYVRMIDCRKCQNLTGSHFTCQGVVYQITGYEETVSHDGHAVYSLKTRRYDYKGDISETGTVMLSDLLEGIREYKAVILKGEPLNIWKRDMANKRQSVSSFVALHDYLSTLRQPVRIAKSDFIRFKTVEGGFDWTASGVDAKSVREGDHMAKVITLFTDEMVTDGHNVKLEVRENTAWQHADIITQLTSLFLYRREDILFLCDIYNMYSRKGRDGESMAVYDMERRELRILVMEGIDHWSPFVKEVNPVAIYDISRNGDVTCQSRPAGSYTKASHEQIDRLFHYLLNTAWSFVASEVSYNYHGAIEFSEIGDKTRRELMSRYGNAGEPLQSALAIRSKEDDRFNAAYDYLNRLLEEHLSEEGSHFPVSVSVPLSEQYGHGGSLRISELVHKAQGIVAETDCGEIPFDALAFQTRDYLYRYGVVSSLAVRYLEAMPSDNLPYPITLLARGQDTPSSGAPILTISKMALIDVPSLHPMSPNGRSHRLVVDSALEFQGGTQRITTNLMLRETTAAGLYRLLDYVKDFSMRSMSESSSTDIYTDNKVTEETSATTVSVKQVSVVPAEDDKEPTMDDEGIAPHGSYPVPTGYFHSAKMLEEEAWRQYGKLLVDKINLQKFYDDMEWVSPRTTRPRMLFNVDYTGINALMLSLFTESHGYDLPIFIDEKTVKEDGLALSNESKPFPVFTDKGELRYVYNIEETNYGQSHPDETATMRKINSLRLQQPSDFNSLHNTLKNGHWIVSIRKGESLDESSVEYDSSEDIIRYDAPDKGIEQSTDFKRQVVMAIVSSVISRVAGAEVPANETDISLVRNMTAVMLGIDFRFSVPNTERNHYWAKAILRDVHYTKDILTLSQRCHDFITGKIKEIGDKEN